jgi:DNA-binding MarR family transcriptional regulator/GNAT superfamily N-acetyltransferase
MDESQLQSVRRFNRLVTQRVGALEVDYLRRGRPLAEARLIFEIGADGVDVRALRCKLGLDSGYLSRLLQSLKTQGLIAVTKGDDDGRRRHLSLTRKGNAERAAYDRLSDNLVESMLALLDASEQARLVAAMSEVERLIRAASIKVAAESPQAADARFCLSTYFHELAARFESGFDVRTGDRADVEDMTPPSGLFVIARLDGDAVGCGGFKRVDKTTGEIKRVWTAPSARGIGVARRMLRTLEAAAQDRGLKTLRLDTNRALTEAHALYRSEGYREVARFNDNPYAHHWFEKRL